jgi:RNA recognition motif-containing protein
MESDVLLASISTGNVIRRQNTKKEEVGMQGSKLYVGNLNYSANNENLKELFSEHGEVREIKIIEGKGFGFVEMATQAEAEKAKKELNGIQFMGRTITVDEARPQRDRQRRSPRRY